MDPNQNEYNKKPDLDQRPAETQANNVPPNLPVVPEEKLTAPPVTKEDRQVPQKDVPSLEEQIGSANNSVIASKDSGKSTEQKVVTPKEDEASSYGKTDIKPLRTFERDVADVKRLAGEDDGGEVVQREIGKKDAPPPIAQSNKSAVEEAPQENKEKALETLRKKEIEQELAKSGIVPTPSVEEKQPEEKTSISPIKTFRDDAATEVKDRNLSVVSIAAAQSKKRIQARQEMPVENESKLMRNLSVVILSLVLIGSGAGLVWFFYQGSLKGSGITPEPEITSLISAETRSEIDVTGTQGNILDRLQKEGSTDAEETSNTIKQLSLVENVLGSKKLITAQEFLARIDPSVPNRLIRSVDPEYMLGQYIVQDENNLFLIFTTDSFETTFASMLEWEQTMNSDLAPYFGPILSSTANIRLGNATSTAERQVFIPRIFHDVIVQNVDTRLLRDDNGDIALLYAFPNQNTLIITTDENTFFEVFRRLTTSR